MPPASGTSSRTGPSSSQPGQSARTERHSILTIQDRSPGRAGQAGSPTRLRARSHPNNAGPQLAAKLDGWGCLAETSTRNIAGEPASFNLTYRVWGSYSPKRRPLGPSGSGGFHLREPTRFRVGVLASVALACVPLP